MNNKNKGFTFVEVLISISIIILIWVVAMTNYFWMKNNSNNSKIESDLVTLQNSFISYYNDKEEYPMPKWNQKFFWSDGSYRHSEESQNLHWVSGFVTQNILDKKYLDYTPLDPNTSQYYGYAKTMDNSGFEIAWVLINGNEFTSKVYWNYTWETWVRYLVREYAWNEFVENNSHTTFPYNPYEMVLIWSVENINWTVNVNDFSAIDGTQVTQWDIVFVGAWSSASIYYSDGSEVMLWDTSENTELYLTDLSYKWEDNLLTSVSQVLKSWNLFVKASKMNTDWWESEFNVYTDDVVASVRWTIFWVNAENNEISLIEWEVEVEELPEEAKQEIQEIAQNTSSTIDEKTRRLRIAEMWENIRRLRIEKREEITNTWSISVEKWGTPKSIRLDLTRETLEENIDASTAIYENIPTEYKETLKQIQEDNAILKIDYENFIQRNIPDNVTEFKFVNLPEVESGTSIIPVFLKKYKNLENDNIWIYFDKLLPNENIFKKTDQEIIIENNYLKTIKTDTLKICKWYKLTSSTNNTITGYRALSPKEKTMASLNVNDIRVSQDCSFFPEERWEIIEYSTLTSKTFSSGVNKIRITDVKVQEYESLRTDQDMPIVYVTKNNWNYSYFAESMNNDKNIVYSQNIVQVCKAYFTQWENYKDIPDNIKSENEENLKLYFLWQWSIPYIIKDCDLIIEDNQSGTVLEEDGNDNIISYKDLTAESFSNNKKSILFNDLYDRSRNLIFYIVKDNWTYKAFLQSLTSDNTIKWENIVKICKAFDSSSLGIKNSISNAIQGKNIDFNIIWDLWISYFPNYVKIDKTNCDLGNYNNTNSN